MRCRKTKKNRRAVGAQWMMLFAGCLVVPVLCAAELVCAVGYFGVFGFGVCRGLVPVRCLFFGWWGFVVVGGPGCRCLCPAFVPAPASLFTNFPFHRAHTPGTAMVLV
jgi:hypothetical protein